MQGRSFRTLLLGASAALAFATVAPAHAYAQFEVQLNYNTDLSTPGVGVGYNFGLGSLTKKNNITGVASFNYYLPKTYGVALYNQAKTDYWEANFNGKMDIKSVPGLYAGAGVGIGHTSYTDTGVYGTYFNGLGSSDFHLNILGGFNFSKKSKGPFAEAGFNLGGGSAFRIGVGLRF